MSAAQNPPSGAAPGPAAPVPGLTHVFSLRGELAPPLEYGRIDGLRKRFIPVTGGVVYGPRLSGRVLPGGGDWQSVADDGLSHVLARYTIEAADGTLVGVTNAGVRTASREVMEKLVAGIEVPPDAYYFRTSPVFEVADGPHGWLRRHLFVARGIRKPDHVIVDFYLVD
jgi:hypothetical protein